MADFYNLKVADIYKETEDTSVVTFEIPVELKEQFQKEAQKHKRLDRKFSYSIYVLTGVSTLLASASGLFDIYDKAFSLLIVACTASIGIITSLQGKRKAEDLWLIELHLFHAFSDLEREFEYRQSRQSDQLDTDYFFEKINQLLNESKIEWQKSVLEKNTKPLD